MMQFSNTIETAFCDHRGITMKLGIIALSVTFLLAAPVAAEELGASNSESSDATSTDTKETNKPKKPKKITDRRHPDYVRCRSEPIIGSLARKRRICMTNAEWAEYVKAGARDSRQFVEDMQVGEGGSN
jgi:nitrate reductase cytochrome c-type subunit